jgi:hypothetical protein
MKQRKKQSSKKYGAAILCNAFCAFFLCAYAGAEIPSYTIRKILLSPVPVARSYHPFNHYAFAAVDLLYSAPYGLDDTQSFAAEGGFSRGQLTMAASISGLALADVYKKSVVCAGASWAAPKNIFIGAEIEREMELFSGDTRMFSMHSVNGSLGLAFRHFCMPFIGAQGFVEDKTMLFSGGVLFDAWENSSFGLLLKQNFGYPTGLAVCHRITLAKYLSAGYCIENQPVRFEAEIRIGIARKIIAHAAYKTHNSLGGTFLSGIMFAPCAD